MYCAHDLCLYILAYHFIFIIDYRWAISMDVYKQFPGISNEIEGIASNLGFDFNVEGKLSVDCLLELYDPSSRYSNSNSSASREFNAGLFEAVGSLLRKSERKTPLGGHTPFGLEEIDQKLKGGFQLEGISEVFGVSGSGKSHVVAKSALESIVNGQAANSPAETLIICTEGPLETRRLLDMSSNGSNDELNNVTYIYCSDIDVFDHIIFTQLPAFLEGARREGRCFNMIIIDSIAHHLRNQETFEDYQSSLSKVLHEQEMDPRIAGYSGVKSPLSKVRNKFYKVSSSFRSYMSRANYLMKLYAELNRLSRSNNLAVVLTNQVSDFFERDVDDGGIHIPSMPLEFLQQVGVYSGWSFQLLNRRLKDRGYKEAVKSNSFAHENSSSSIGRTDTSGYQNREEVWQDEDSLSIASLGLLWSRLLTSRLRILKSRSCCGDSNSSVAPLLFRPLTLHVAFNLLSEEPAKYIITSKGFKSLNSQI